MRSSTWSSTGLISTGGSISPVGRITCSAKTPPVCSSSHGPGVAETATVCGRIASHSLKRSGRLSMQEGRRKPYSASVDLAAMVAARHRADLRHRLVALVDEQQGVFGQVFEQGRRRLAGQAAGEEAAVILDAGAASRWRRSSRGRNWCAARAAALRAAALGVQFLEPLGQLEPDRLHRLLQGRAGRDVVASWRRP